MPISKADTEEISSWVEWFDRRARHYRDPLRKLGYYAKGKFIPHSVMDAIIKDTWEKLAPDRMCRLVDVGGGLGLFARAFQAKLKHAVTTDMSFSMLTEGRKLNRGGDFLMCEASAMPFASSSFDRLLCYSVFHYLKDLSHAKKVLEEFIRVVDDGGLMLIGDIPSRKEIREKNRISSSGKTAKNKRMHYPKLLRHNLKYRSYDPVFFQKFCSSNKLHCRVLPQNIVGKPTSSSRFDVLIRVVK